MMSGTREEMDRAVDEHFRFEADDDIDGVLASLADGVEHEVIPSPFGTHGDVTKIRAYYEMLFASVRGESTTPVRRLYGDDFLVDETVWHGFVEDGRPFLCDGKSGQVSFRILHVFRFKEGKITVERAWLDLAAIQSQLGCVVS
jgi:ketosteroid isomerase-like protein